MRKSAWSTGRFNIGLLGCWNTSKLLSLKLMNMNIGVSVTTFESHRGQLYAACASVRQVLCILTNIRQNLKTSHTRNVIVQLLVYIPLGWDVNMSPDKGSKQSGSVCSVAIYSKQTEHSFDRCQGTLIGILFHSLLKHIACIWVCQVLSCGNHPSYCFT